MHSYLRSVGFSQFVKHNDINALIKDTIKNYDEKTVVKNQPGDLFVEFSKFYGCDLGLTVCGQYDEQNKFHFEYYFPFFRGNGVTTNEHVTVEKRSDQNAFEGACDDLRIGITLIFYLLKPAQYMREKMSVNPGSSHIPLTISGLSNQGMILFPVKKDKEQVRAEKEMAKVRTEKIAAAMDGDEEAMESLTMEEMDIYSSITERIRTDDIFTIVDTYFMPHGIECDQYNILGEITDIISNKNTITNEEVIKLTLDCNDMNFDICINKQDLLGEPAIGRRFKGTIWLQGELHY